MTMQRTSARFAACLAAFILAVPASLMAQAKPAGAVGPNAIDGNGPVFYPGPPAGFDAEAASEADLAHYGLPPRPGQSEPALYGYWKKLVTTPSKRLTNLAVETTNVVNGIIQDQQDQGYTGNAITTNASNWSGYAVTGANGTFTVNDSFVYGQWMVPAPGTDNCSYAPYAASQWIGLDGYNSNDVLQAGTAITTCGTTFVAWYEWYTGGCTASSTSQPCYQTNFSLPIAAGDLVTVEVWYTSAAPNGHAFFSNGSSGQSVSIGFSQPAGSSGSSYVGNSIEWIVERPTINGSLSDLANYIAVPMNLAFGFNGAYFFYPGSSPSGTTIHDITMTCPPWNPSTACTATTNLSAATLYGGQTLWFYDEGPAN
jgi:hypothetical protein